MFQSTRPARGATRLRRFNAAAVVLFQSTRPARGATPLHGAGVLVFAVSIHAPRAGRDANCHCSADHSEVSIHAPRAGRDKFLRRLRTEPDCFNPRAPRGARPAMCIPARLLCCFNPRAPRGARHVRPGSKGKPHHVSIHAPRAGRDQGNRADAHTDQGFNPRAPRGARRTPTRQSIPITWFQSTRPARGATPLTALICLSEHVSIHAPRAGRDESEEIPHG